MAPSSRSRGRLSSRNLQLSARARSAHSHSPLHVQLEEIPMRPRAPIWAGTRLALAGALFRWPCCSSRSRRRANRWGRCPAAGFCSTAAGAWQPAGKQIPLDTLPMATALSPDGKYLLVLNGGYRPPSDQRDRDRIGRAW